MSTQTSGAPYNPSRRLSPDQVREATFSRVPLGRRGVDEDEVQVFVGRLAEELAAREAEIAQLADENRRLKHAMREWHRQQVGYDSAELMARTQQEIEAQIAQAERYSREREQEAAQRYEQIVGEARRLAHEELGQRGERPMAEPPEPVGPGGQTGPGATAGAVDPDRLEQQRVYIQGLLQALDGLAAHVDAARRAFSLEVGRQLGQDDHPVAGPTDSADWPPAEAEARSREALDVEPDGG